VGQEDAEKLLKLLQRRSFGIGLWAYVASALIALSSSALTAFIVTKSQNLATKQDLEEMTRVAESVRTEISNASWQSQRVWEEKKALYTQVIKLLDGSNSNLMMCQFRAAKLPLDSEKTPPWLLRDLLREMDSLKELSQIIAVSGVFLAPEAQAAVEAYRRSAGVVTHNPDTGQVTIEMQATTIGDVCRTMRERAMAAREKVVSAARADLAFGLARAAPPR
jgi:hypothetical protein